MSISSKFHNLFKRLRADATVVETDVKTAIGAVIQIATPVVEAARDDVLTDLTKLRGEVQAELQEILADLRTNEVNLVQEIKAELAKLFEELRSAPVEPGSTPSKPAATRRPRVKQGEASEAPSEK